MTTTRTVGNGHGKAKGGIAPPPAPEKGVTPFGIRRIPAGEKVALVRNYFDMVAQRYDLMNTLLSFGIHYLWKRTSIELLKLNEGDWVLDICGGTGDLSILAAKRIGPAGRIVLYDINRAMMEAGRGKSTHAAERRKILYIQGDAQRTAFASDSFDAVVVGFGIRNLADREAGLREIYRILKPGGRFVCLEFSRPTAAWFRFLYDFYSIHIMPLLGRLIVGSRQAYTYLHDSIRLFPSPMELSAILEEIGFQGVSYHRLTNGIACLHSGVKRER